MKDRLQLCSRLSLYWTISLWCKPSLDWTGLPSAAEYFCCKPLRNAGSKRLDCLVSQGLSLSIGRLNGDEDAAREAQFMNFLFKRKMSNVMGSYHPGLPGFSQYACVARGPRFQMVVIETGIIWQWPPFQRWWDIYKALYQDPMDECCGKVGPTSVTLARHWNNIGSTSCVCWEYLQEQFSQDC